MPGTRTPYPHSNPSSSSVDSAAGLIHIIGIKTSDTTRASTTTETQDTDLTVTLITGHKYRIGLMIAGEDLSAASAGGFSCSFGGTAVADNIQLLFDGTGDTAEVSRGIVTAIGTITSAASVVNFNLRLDGSLRCTAGGTLFVKWAQASSAALGFKVFAGSFIDVTDLGL